MLMEYDVIVVGAGPAGSMCARQLGQKGRKVLLIEKERFPRDKPCGDFVSSRLCEHLKSLEIYPALKMVPHCPMDGLLFSHPSVGQFELRGDTPGLMCRRTSLDAVLFEEAKKHVDVLEGVKIKELIFEKGRVVGVKSEENSFFSKNVVGADGANGIVAKKLGAGALDENHNAVAVRSYYSGLKGLNSLIELHFIDEVQPGYFWIFPTDLEKGEANVGLGILSACVRNQNVQLKNLLEKVVKERFKDAVLLEPIKGWSLPFGSKKRPRTFPGALLIGDAGGLIDPLSGEGIHNAIRSAECAAEAILSQDLSLYEKYLDKTLQGELRKAYLIQKVSRNPFVLKLLFHVLKHSKKARQALANKFF